MILLRMVLRNMWRHRLRSFLTFATVFFGALLSILYLGGKNSYETMMGGDTLRGTMLVYPASAAPLVGALPNSHVDEVVKVPGVAAATPVSEVMFKRSADAPGERDGSFIGVDPAGLRKIAGSDLDSLSKETLDEFERDPEALLCARGIAVAQGFRVGTRVELPLRPGETMLMYPGYTLPPGATFGGRFVGIIDHGVFSDQVIVAHRSRMEKALNWQRGVGILVKAKPGEDADTVARRIEAHFSKGGLEGVKVLMLDLWVEGLGTLISQVGAAFALIIVLVGLVSITIMVFNVSMSAADLLPQIGTMRALGLSRAGALFILGAEGVFLSVGAALLAVSLVYITTANTDVIDLKKIDYILAPRFSTTILSAGKIVVFAFVLAVLGSLVPAAAGARASIASLRRR